MISGSRRHLCLLRPKVLKKVLAIGILYSSISAQSKPSQFTIDVKFRPRD
jgi:hypothetical protein